MTRQGPSQGGALEAGRCRSWFAPTKVHFHTRNWDFARDERRAREAAVRCDGYGHVHPWRQRLVEHQCHSADGMACLARDNSSRRTRLAACLKYSASTCRSFTERATKRVFLRLQHEIIHEIDDQSLVAWTIFMGGRTWLEGSGLPARAPELFANKSTSIAKFRWDLPARAPPLWTNQGLQIDLFMCQDRTWRVLPIIPVVPGGSSLAVWQVCTGRFAVTRHTRGLCRDRADTLGTNRDDQR